MAKVTITFEDEDETFLNCRFDSDPPVEDEKMTNAQRLGLHAMEVISKLLKGDEDGN